MAQPPYPDIASYALIGDCHSAALVSSSGSIDWCCMPRMDHGSTFGRLLDWDEGGYCLVAAADEKSTSSRSYLPRTLVLETVFSCPTGKALLLDCFTVHVGGKLAPYRQLLRIVDGLEGTVPMTVEVAPRFDYGTTTPWVRQHRPHLWSAVGGDDAIVISADADLEIVEYHWLRGEVPVKAGHRFRLSITNMKPEAIDPHPPRQPDDKEIDHRLDETIKWWRGWADPCTLEGVHLPAALRSAVVLKALTNAPTGAIAAAPTTSLPEVIGGDRNWDYRFSWIRDSQFTVRSLGQLGFHAEADGFRRFIERTAAGRPDELQIMYGLDGRRRLTEVEIPLEGYRGSSPVRIGNAASEQTQLDVYGELLDLAWRWHVQGRSPDQDYWRFLMRMVEIAGERWRDPDRGLWEMRADPRHFVHSKAMCWAAFDRGIRISEDSDLEAPLDEWRKARDEIHAEVMANGVDPKRRVFVQSFGSTELDAALLLLPSVDFVAYDDEVMVATTDAIAEELDDGGLVRRYNADDGLGGREGVFVAGTFWLAECYAYQGRFDLAQAAFDRAGATANDLGLFPEEYDPHSRQALGNFPQGLSHLSHIAAAVALSTRPTKA